MKLHETIKHRRQLLNLSQADVADYLDVSMQAVSKWERGQNYPDVSLLPLLARLLKVDLNQLFDFEATLSEREVKHFVEELLGKMQEPDDFGKVFKLGIDKVQEYPQCEFLALNVALLLEQFMDLFAIDKKPKYLKPLARIFGQLEASDDLKIRHATILNRVPRLLEAKDYDQAEKLIDVLPEPLDKRVWQGEVYLKQKRLEEAETVFEKKLVHLLTELTHVVWGLAETAYGQKQSATGKFYEALLEQVYATFGLNEAQLLNIQINIALVKNDTDSVMALLFQIWDLKGDWLQAKSPVISNLMEKHLTVAQGDGYEMAEKIMFMEQVKTAPEFAEVRKHKDYQKLLERFKEE